MDSNVFSEQTQTIFLAGKAGKIEALNSRVTSPVGIAIICHPHPLQGGTMHNKVVTTLHKAFHEANMNTVRFNFRGVGESEGQFDQGEGETDDLLSIIKDFSELHLNLPFYLAGFSFGSYIAYRAAISSLYKNRIQQLISVAPPVYPLLLNLPAPLCKWVVIQGEKDEVINPQTVYDWLKKLGHPEKLIRFPETGHFFHGKLIELKHQVLKHLAT